MSSATPRAASSRWLVLVLVCLAQFMVILDATIVNVALPAIQTDLGFSAADLPWVVNAYTLLFGGFLLLGGRAGDLFGRKRLFLAGIALFTTASLLDGLSTSPAMLVAARAAQGLGAALVSPAALSIITTTFTEPAERTRALGIWAGIAGGGGAIGLLAGGFLTDALSWEWNFFINVPIGLATLALAVRHVPESRIAKDGPFDLGGALLATIGLVLLTYAIVKAQDWGWVDGRTLGIGGGGLAVLAAFVAFEARHPSPLVRLDILRTRSLAVANTTLLLVVGAMFSMFFFGSLYLQQIRGFDALETGLAFLPFTLGIILGSVLSQGLIQRFGVKAVLLSGLLVGTLGMVFMTGLGPDSSYVSGFLPGIVLLALGIGNTFVPLTLTATSGVDPEHAGLASGVFNTAQQVGGALGLAILSTVAADVTGASTAAASLVDGYTAAFTVGAGLMVGGIVLTALLLRRRDVEDLATTAEAALVAA